MDNHTQYHLVAADYLGNFRFHLKFKNGKEGNVDLLPIIKSHKYYDLLNDEEVCKQLTVHHYTLGNDEIDICPEILFSALTS